jgi:hypothetical protein
MTLRVVPFAFGPVEPRAGVRRRCRPGSSNLHAVARCRDLDELFEFTSDRIGSYSGLEGMEVSPVLRHIKQARTLPSGDRLVRGAD